MPSERNSDSVRDTDLAAVVFTVPSERNSDSSAIMTVALIPVKLLIPASTDTTPYENTVPVATLVSVVVTAGFVESAMVATVVHAPPSTER